METKTFHEVGKYFLPPKLQLGPYLTPFKCTSPASQSFNSFHLQVGELVWRRWRFGMTHPDSSAVGRSCSKKNMTTQAANQLDTGSAPLSFFYTHLHDAIRAELETLSALFLKLESSPGGKKEIETQLAYLRGRYRFLEQVYKYHSSVEDEVSVARSWLWMTSKA